MSDALYLTYISQWERYADAGLNMISFGHSLPGKYIYDYFGFKTLERNYLLKANGRIVERPQHMLMRVAVGIHKADIEAALTTYQLMSEG